MYAALWTKSHFSFLEGASRPEELVQLAHNRGLTALALTDRDGVYGLPRAYMAAKTLGVKLLAGAQFSVKGSETPLVVLAQTRAGYGGLCQLLSLAQSRHPKGQAEIAVEEVAAAHAGLICLTADVGSMATLHSAFGDRLYARMARHCVAESAVAEDLILRQAKALGVVPVAAPEVLYHAGHRRDLQDVLTCIRHRLVLSEAETALRPNDQFALPTLEQVQRLYADVPEWIEASNNVAARCTFGLEQLNYRYPAANDGSDLPPAMQLRQQVRKGLTWRYGVEVPQAVHDQLEKELSLIEELDFGGYFLSMWEIVQFCQRAGILCQGRGSAANSVVCYCLGITAIDPINMRLLFARFLSRERAEPPDIDLDIEHHRREEVIQWVYARYGRRHAAMVANVVRFRWRSAVREVGRTLGLPAIALDKLAKLLGLQDMALEQGFPDEVLDAAGLDAQSPLCAMLWRLSTEILDFPRHLSIHPGGFLLGEEPVDTLVPIEPATLEGRTVIQWDKQDVEDLGLFKVDLLGLGALSCVHDCFDMVAQVTGHRWTMATIPQEDPETYRMISRGDTVGVFQIESRAQMAMLPRLKPKTFYDLVVEVAIVRPGPIQGDMVHPYLRQRNSGQKPVYPHPRFAEILDKTYGVPIFQEQVMKLAMVAADYTPAEADMLRRDMAAWRSSDRIERHHLRLTRTMIQKGVPAEFAERVFAQIRGFGEYGFPESHAASFALIVYVTAYLRRHYPEAFACALLNAQPMGFYSPATIVHDAKRHGVVVLPIDVNQSDWSCRLEALPQTQHPTLMQTNSNAGETSHTPKPTWAIRMGLAYVRGFGVLDKAAFEHTPKPFTDLQDVVARLRLSSKSMLALAQSGALDSLGQGSRRAILWSLRGLLTERDDTLPMPSTALKTPQVRRAHGQASLFAPLSADESILWDYQQTQHSTRGHPMQSVRPRLGPSIPDALSINSMADKTRVTYVGMVICRQRPQTAQGVTFLTLEDETGFVNIVLWKDVYLTHTILAKTASLLGVQGRLQREGTVVHLVAQKLFAPELVQPHAAITSRNFQ